MSKLESISQKRQEAQDLRKDGIYISRSALDNMKSIKDILGEITEETDDEILASAASVKETSHHLAADVVIGEGGSLLEKSNELASEAASESMKEAAKSEKGKGIFERIAGLRFGKNKAADGASKAGAKAAEYRDMADQLLAEAQTGIWEYEEIVAEFDGLPVDRSGFVCTTPEAHDAFLKECDQCDFVKYDQSQNETIFPAMIEGVNIGGQRELNNPDIFWNHHNNSKARYTEMASHIPEVQKRMQAGESLEQIRANGSASLQACVTNYFGENRVKVWKADGYYSFNGDGRHRVLIARELGYQIPVTVLGDVRPK